jgi:hypothetical protein
MVKSKLGIMVSLLKPFILIRKSSDPNSPWSVTCSVWSKFSVDPVLSAVQVYSNPANGLLMLEGTLEVKSAFGSVDVVP